MVSEDDVVKTMVSDTFSPLFSGWFNGVEKSAVSEVPSISTAHSFSSPSSRSINDFRDQQIIVALGIGIDGQRTVLGLREGGTEKDGGRDRLPRYGQPTK